MTQGKGEEKEEGGGGEEEIEEGKKCGRYFGFSIFHAFNVFHRVLNSN